MKFSLKPTDTFFFRDGKPFSRGEQTEAEGIFPPLPSTIFGALRTSFISQNSWKDFEDEQLKDKIGTKQGYNEKCLKIKGVFLEEINTGFYYPMPMDIVRDDDDNFVLNKLDAPISNARLKISLSHNKDTEIENIDGGFLSHDSMTEYLTGQLSDFSFLDPENENDQFFVKEPKVGIARAANTLTTREGNLYRIDMRRLKENFRIMVQFENLDEFDANVIKLGGENKIFSCSKSDNSDLTLDIDAKVKKKIISGIDNKFKLYLATPAIFKDGWLPDWIDTKTLKGSYNGITVELITCVLGKYQCIGGWDMATRRPKTMFRTVPAGSVYYFKSQDAPDKIFDTFHYENISDINAQEGFGLAFVGVTKIDLEKEE